LRRAARRRQIDQICLPDLVSTATPAATPIGGSGVRRFWRSAVSVSLVF
jgi:hypothetical protein